jgi:cellulose synthase/poly-beta-1,6-N-acetylglucosamine synthase-like glycosyltransferase
MFLAITCITFFLAALYSGLILYFNLGWTTLKRYVPSGETAPGLKFSIIIPARNEEKSIIPCLADIISQDYPSENFEVIVVDDFSDDQTASLVKEFIGSNPDFSIRLIKLGDIIHDEKNSFKKLAIKTAIDNSRYDWIITSDADCRHGKKWLRTIGGYIQEKDLVMLSAPVSFGEQGSFFGRYQSLEFSSLVAIGAASIAMNTPNMCNGANLAYLKKAFYEVDGYSGFDHIASGDDEFLLHKMHKKWPGKISFIKNTDAIAYTQPAPTIEDLLMQRKRWVSKSRLYDRKAISFILAGAYVFHLLLLFTMVAGFFDPWYFMVFAMGLSAKIMAEFILLWNVTAFFNRKKDLNFLIPSAFLYIFYVLFIGIYGNFGTYNWKGRTVK